MTADTAPVSSPLDVRPGPPWLKWAGIGFAVVIVGLVALRLVHHDSRSAPPPPFTATRDAVEIPPQSPTWKYLQFETATPGEPLALEPVPARVAFDEARALPIVAPLPGRVDAVAARLGQRVDTGDRLVAIRSTALIDLAKEIDALRSEEAMRAKAAERQRALLALKAAPEKDLLAAEQELRQANLAREAAEKKLRSFAVAVTSEGLYWVTAPRPGVIVERNVLTGQEVGPDRSDALLVIADIDEVIVTADVPESDVAGIEVGQPATIVSATAPERQIPGRVEYVGEVVDPVRRMVNVRVRVLNVDRDLRPNSFVQATFSADGPSRIIVPAQAVVSDGRQPFVFVRPADHPDRLVRRGVSIGRRAGGSVEIINGLAPGDVYVSKGALLLLNAVDLASAE